MPSTRDEVWVRRVRGFGFEHRLIKAGRQGVDQVDVAGELAVLLLRDTA
jgi:hypothetical protein